MEIDLDFDYSLVFVIKWPWFIIVKNPNKIDDEE